MLKLRLHTMLLFILLSIVPVQAQRGPIIERDATTRFAVIGDYGNNSRAQAEVAALIRRLAPDFIITTGDNNYPAGQQSTIDTNIGQYFSSYIAPYNGQYGNGSGENRFFPSIGNHDWDTGFIKPYTDYFTLPGNERYYEFNWSSVRLFAINSDEREPDGARADSQQAQWLRERLAATSEIWRIVYFHHAPYSSAEDTDYMRWNFADWGASAVISGHAHSYERLTVNGIPYIVNGMGGARVDNFETIAEGSQIRFNAAHGAMLVEATENSITFNYHGIYGRPISSINQIPPDGEWIELDVTSTVQNNGVYSFILDGTYSEGMRFSSLEHVDNPPELVLELVNSDTALQLPAKEDATVDYYASNQNFGREDNLQVSREGSEHKRIYLQFEVSGMNPDMIETATVRLYTTFDDDTRGGMALYLADNVFNGTTDIWTQDEITWDNAPQIQVDVSPIDSFTLQQ